ncbi:hypothetical protein [uncultured Duncaniella sp.]|uniref:hypothetical protein n=1 Tax=uncultured Duncaniella sp. TaxID=2768039 RepID=UPI00260E4C5A|nr:hypothetical protein [uncultured Duncaniella sp.]
MPSGRGETVAVIVASGRSGYGMAVMAGHGRGGRAWPWWVWSGMAVAVMVGFGRGR